MLNNISEFIEVKNEINSRLNIESYGTDIKTIKISSDSRSLFITKQYNDYYRIYTEPYAKKVSFSFYAFNTNNELFITFKNLIKDVIANYYMYQNKKDRVVFNPEERYIAFLSDTNNPNILKMEYDPLVTIITLTIYLNPKNEYTNNSVILDREGALFLSFYSCFQDFFDELTLLSEKDEPKKIRKNNIFGRLLKK